MANSVDADQTLRSAASNLGLHCLKGLSVPVFRITYLYPDIVLITIQFMALDKGLISALNLTLAMVNKLRCHTHFELSANQIA